MWLKIKPFLKKIPGTVFAYALARQCIKHVRFFFIWGAKGYWNILKAYSNELNEIDSKIREFSSDDIFDFRGALLPLETTISPDAFFNVLYPHASNISYDSETVDLFFGKLAQDYSRLFFWGGEHRTPIKRTEEVHSFYAHGFTYFREAVRINSGDTVFDIGAAPGEFSAVCAALGAKRVFAFEPDARALSGLKKTAALNPKISVHSYFISNETDDSLKKITLDRFIQSHDVRNVDFIKMDIEGAELDALRGCHEILSRFAPKLAVCTYHTTNIPDEMIDFILSRNSSYIFNKINGILYAHCNAERSVAR